MWSSSDVELDRRTTWVQNCPFLYNLVGSWTLEWPAYVCKWLKGPENGYSLAASTPWIYSQRLVYSSRVSLDTGGNDQLIIAEVKFPFMLPLSRQGASLRGGGSAASAPEQLSLAPTLDLSHFESTRGFSPTPTYTAPQYDFSHTLKAQINHPGEINNIETSADFPFHIVSISSNGTCYVWDYASHRSKPESGAASTAQAILAGGHDTEGFALAWSDKATNSSTSVVSGAADGSLCLWDIAAGRLQRRLDYHTSKGGSDSRGASLNDVSWIPRVADLTLAVYEDGSVAIWDFRSRSDNPSAGAVHQGEGDHGVPVNAVDCSSLDSHVFATGANNGSTCIWDTRMLKRAVYSVAETGSSWRGTFPGPGGAGKRNEGALWCVSAAHSPVNPPSMTSTDNGAPRQKLPAINCLEWLPEPFQSQLLVCRQSGIVEILDPSELDSTADQQVLPTNISGVGMSQGPQLAGTGSSLLMSSGSGARAGIVATHCGHDAEVTGAAATVFSTGLELQTCFSGNSFPRRLHEALMVVSVSADNILQVWNPAFPPTATLK